MKKFLLVSSLLTGLIFAGGNSVMAQQTLPQAGDSFDSAVLLQPGTYESGVLDGETGLEEYYFIQGVKPGKEIKITGVFIASSNIYATRNRIVLYNERMEELLNVDEANNSSVAFSASWLPNSDYSTYKYYIKIADEGLSRTKSFSLEISLVDRYDANSQTDAGDSIDKAMTIASIGNYQSYLAGCYDCLPFDIKEGGTDFKDFYKIAVKKGQTLNIEVVPPPDAKMELAIYNTKRQLLKSETAENKGAIITTSLNIANDGDIFAAVICEEDCSPKLVAYTLNTTTAIVPGEKPVVIEVACDEDSDCPTGLVCLDGQCVSTFVPPPSSVCEDKCESGQTKCFDNFNYNKCGDFDENECLEWSTPVYCGEGNKCEGGECVEATDCQCSAWVDEGCAGNDCEENEMYQTRTCTPAGCDSKEQCLADPTCIMPIECLSNSECGKGFVCQEGMCIYKGNGEGWGGFFPTVPGALFSGWHSWLYLILTIAFYIYFAICLQTLAKKTDTPNGWLAWIPVANIFLMLQIAQKPLWWFILLLIPLVNIIIGIIIWMKIAERMGKPNWLGILLIVPVVGIIIPGYLAFSGKEKIEITPPYAATGTQEANKPVVGYKHPCKYCEKLIPPNSTVCPFCGKANPLGPYRCPKCHEPIEKEWQVCPKCNQNLRIVCPHCGKITFFGDHCEDCGARLFVKCPHCGQEQPPLSDNCIKCGKPLKVERE